MKKESVSITTLTPGVNNTQVLLEGQLIIKNANAIKMALLAALNSSQNLEIVFSNIIKIDLAVLQLLVALQKSAARLEKKLFFNMESTGILKSVIQNSGLEKILITNFKSLANGLH